MIRRPRPLWKLDERLGFVSVARTSLGKIFPDHWSFMLGEIALYSFLLLVATGVFLTFFFEPSSALQLYDGSYAPLQDRSLSGAYASTVELSWDVRGGLLMRQAHHWAAHVFIGAIALHLCRIFFTAMFRRPRELNWTIGITLLILSIFNAFAGYSLPDDLLSGTGLRIFEAILVSIPVIGGWATFLFFGEQFPGDYIIERLYILHVFLVPALLALLIGMHLAILVRQKHSHFPGPGRRDSNVVGSRVWPAYALRSMALLFTVSAVVFLLGGLVQINPIWVWGDYEPQTILSPAVADWYILWIEGMLRLFPPVEFYVFGHLVPQQFWPGVFLPGLAFLTLYLWPWLDRRLTGDRGSHHLTGRPREAPVRVAIGAAAITCFAVLLAAGSEELISEWTRWPVGAIRNTLRVLVFVLPAVVGALAWWMASALRRSGRAHGMELGRKELLHRHPRAEEEEEQAEEAERETVDEHAG